MNTQELKDALKAKFSPPAFGILWEVGNSTGAGTNRHADAVAMSLWPSRGLEVIGFEIKASRYDWQKELANPSKAEPICRYCDRWYIVTNRDIVQSGELPPTWGLMMPRGSSLIVDTEAPKLTPVELDRAFMAAVFRRAFEQRAEQTAIDAAFAKGKEEGIKQTEDNHDYKKLRDKVTAFEKASGVDIMFGWTNASNIGAAVREVLHGSHMAKIADLRRIESCCESLLSRTREALVDLNVPAP